MSTSIFTENFTSSKAIAHQVMIVEDDKEFATWLKELLERNGYEVLTARDGGQAQSTFVMKHPDFVILDLILPGESGFEVCDRLKRTDERVPVLVLSAIDMADSRRLAERVGADDYLTKSVDPETLLQRIPALAQRLWERTHMTATQDDRRIRFRCKCGKKFKVSVLHAGRSMTCPSCGEPLTVPNDGPAVANK